MNTVQHGILILIRSALSGQALPLPENFRIAEAEPLILEQQVVGLVYEGALLCGIPKTDPVMTRLFQRYCQITMFSNIQAKALDAVFTAFEAKWINYLPVKGCIVKSLYPKPAMRIMGDADVLIQMEQYDRIRPIMEELGFVEQAPHAHELPWSSKALHLELHRSLMPTHHIQEYQHFANVWDSAILTEGHRYDLSVEDSFLYLFVHYMKHYRAGGIGVRQPIDLWVWQQAYPNMNMDILRTKLEELSLLAFFEYTQTMLRVWFDDQQPDERSVFMTNYIFSSGCFGAKEQVDASHGLLVARQSGSISKGRSHQLRETVFPSLPVMCCRYPVLKRRPWLLPILWPVRWVSAVLFRRNNIRNYRKMLSNASAENIQSFAESLEYVGLDFHL